MRQIYLNFEFNVFNCTHLSWEISPESKLKCKSHPVRTYNNYDISDFMYIFNFFYNVKTRNQYPFNWRS